MRQSQINVGRYYIKKKIKLLRSCDVDLCAIYHFKLKEKCILQFRLNILTQGKHSQGIFLVTFSSFYGLTLKSIRSIIRTIFLVDYITLEIIVHVNMWSFSKMCSRNLSNQSHVLIYIFIQNAIKFCRGNFILSFFLWFGILFKKQTGQILRPVVITKYYL